VVAEYSRHGCVPHSSGCWLECKVVDAEEEEEEEEFSWLGILWEELDIVIQIQTDIVVGSVTCLWLAYHRVN